jgi:hypothetical protein
MTFALIFRAVASRRARRILANRAATRAESGWRARRGVVPAYMC